MKDKLKYSDEQITAVARALCRDNSQICNVNNDDNWKMYSEDYIAQAHVALAALASVKTLDAEGDGGAVAWLHEVIADDGIADLALSFEPDSFPFADVAGYKSIKHSPLYPHPARSGVVSDEDVRDAERYRWLRTLQGEVLTKKWNGESWCDASYTELDKAVDTAIQGERHGR